MLMHYLKGGSYSQYNSQCLSRLTARVSCSCDAEETEIKFRRWRLWKQEMQMRLWLCLYWGLAESEFGGNRESGVRRSVVRWSFGQESWCRSCFRI
jgi:hypothetical protein